MIKRVWMGFKKRIIENEKGLGTVEIVIITAILVGLALLFREQIITFLHNILGKTFSNADGIFET